MTFTIPYPHTDAARKAFSKQYSLNAIYRGKRQAERSKDARYWHERLDCSNHAYIAKMIEDALKGWLIHDDNRKYVKGILHWFSDRDCILVEVKPL